MVKNPMGFFTIKLILILFGVGGVDLSIVLFFIAVVCFVFAACIKYVICLNESRETFMAQATVVMHNVEDYSSRITPIVEFLDNGKLVRSSMASLPKKICPDVGNTVSICYSRNVFNKGKVTYQVWLNSVDNTDDDKFMLKLPSVLIIIACFLIVFGFVLMFV